MGHDRQGAAALIAQLGERQAALEAVLLLGGELEARVDQVTDLAVDVPGERAQPDPDLGRGKPGAGGIEHGVGEVLDQLAQLLVEVDDLERGLAQHGVAEETDRLDGHGISLGSACTRG